ncbi:MAG: ABC transporter permease, partial [Phycisphaerae bacterium]
RASLAAGPFSTALEDFGLQLTPTARRMANFSEVQNSYLSIFAALGGLGLLLGSAAMGIVVLRNVLERRGELALMRAVGFAKGQLQWMVLCEHWALLALGLASGVVSAVVAVLPALISPDASVPYRSWLGTIGAVVASGVLWTVIAAAVALRGRLLEALRSE